MKEQIAKKFASMMSVDQKKQTIQAFYDKNKNNANIDKLVEDMKKMLGYDGDDVPKK